MIEAIQTGNVFDSIQFGIMAIMCGVMVLLLIYAGVAIFMSVDWTMMKQGFKDLLTGNFKGD